jgi:hypothetical protein
MNFLKNNLVSAILVNALLFAVVFLLLHPVYDSGDDVYLLYLLGGGFGQAPTELLHYNHIMHPYLGWIIKSLFSLSPGINWYSVFLYLAHFTSSSVVLFVLLQQHRKKIALPVFAVFFLVFELWFLLQITFTVTAVAVSIAGFYLLLYRIRAGKTGSKLIFPVALLVIASLFRIHVMIPLLIISIPTALALPGKKNKYYFTGALAVALIFITGLNFLQQQYYIRQIPNWQQEENYRQAVFHYFNNPVRYDAAAIPGSGTEREMLESGIFIDKGFLSEEKINALSEEVHYKHRVFDGQTKNSIYWVFIEARIFLLASFTLLTGAFLYSNKANRIAILASAAVAAGILLYLFFFLKLPFYLVPALLCAAAMLPWPLTASKKAMSYPVQNLLLFSSMLLCGAWGFIRAYKINSRNSGFNNAFHFAYKEISSHPDKLFFVTEDLFPMDYFSVWDTPQQYQVKNLLYKDPLFNNTEQVILKPFGFLSVKEIWGSNKVLFWGRQTGTLKKYFREVYKKDIQFSDPLPGFQYREVRQLIIK